MSHPEPALFDPIAAAYARYADITDDLFRPWIHRHLPVAATLHRHGLTFDCLQETVIFGHWRYLGAGCTPGEALLARSVSRRPSD